MGPLQGIRVIEFAGIGPGPFAGMLLADMGAEVLRIERKGARGPVPGDPARDVLNRSKRALALDLKQAVGVDAALRLLERADGLIEGFRPGVMERLGLGPDACLARNPRLIYGRMTGWGQEGPLAHTAGHDLNYISLTGALHAMGPADRPPPPPLNLVGDFGGGGMLLAFGMVCALLETRQSGQGQVVDAAMVDGAALQMAMLYGLRSMDLWQDDRASNFLDGSAHFYGCYACADGGYLAVAPIEPRFYRLLLERCGIDDPDFEMQWDRSRWPEFNRRLAGVFRGRTRAEWCELLEGTDACVTPVLSMAEAPQHPHNRAREAFMERFGVTQPAPAPRFSRTLADPPRPPPDAVADTERLLTENGFDEAEIARLRAENVI
jgi:alpha-methylacyl-CoA racemase